MKTDEKKCARCPHLETAIENAMDKLTNMPCGKIGVNSATMAELDDCAEQGRYCNDDAVYHISQRAWLILQEALKLK